MHLEILKIISLADRAFLIIEQILFTSFIIPGKNFNYEEPF